MICMNEQEFNLSKLIAETGAKNATGEIKNFADDLDLLSNGLEARFEDIVNQVDKLVNMLDVTKFQLTRNDVFRIRNTLKNLEHNLTILKSNFHGFKTYKMRVFTNLLDKQCRFKIAKGYEIIKRFSENEALTFNEYKGIVAKYEKIDEKLGEEIMDCLYNQLSKEEYRMLLNKYDDKEKTIGKQFIKTTMLVIALAGEMKI